MARRIKGITIKLLDTVQSGTDPFGVPVYKERWVDVDNVLIQPNSTEDKINQLNLTGDRAEYTLGIPKGDTHTWEDRKVQFFGETWKTVGIPMQGIGFMIPLDWNKKVQVALDEHEI
ncbi:hypothetical protein [Levyella massiliensis]|jgi:hypothetical protein|uniref:hypothetical protein n=1 Tax=Levyella massiliensis TaxID=938289 RepID=UPI003EBC0218